MFDGCKNQGSIPLWPILNVVVINFKNICAWPRAQCPFQASSISQNIAQYNFLPRYLNRARAHTHTYVRTCAKTPPLNFRLTTWKTFTFHKWTRSTPSLDQKSLIILGSLSNETKVIMWKLKFLMNKNSFNSDFNVSKRMFKDALNAETTQWVFSSWFKIKNYGLLFILAPFFVSPFANSAACSAKCFNPLSGLSLYRY